MWVLKECRNKRRWDIPRDRGSRRLRGQALVVGRGSGRKQSLVARRERRGFGRNCWPACWPMPLQIRIIFRPTNTTTIYGRFSTQKGQPRVIRPTHVHAPRPWDQLISRNKLPTTPVVKMKHLLSQEFSGTSFSALTNAPFNVSSLQSLVLPSFQLLISGQ